MKFKFDCVNCFWTDIYKEKLILYKEWCYMCVLLDHFTSLCLCFLLGKLTWISFNLTWIFPQQGESDRNYWSPDIESNNKNDKSGMMLMWLTTITMILFRRNVKGRLKSINIFDLLGIYYSVMHQFCVIYHVVSLTFCWFYV